MLVATNVLKKYNVTGNVISEVQKRGRARAVGSKSVLLAVTESTFGDTALVLGKAKCANIVGDGPCNQHLGYVLKYADSYHVQLTLRSLLIIDDQTGDPSDETRRKWASVRTSLFWIRGINDGDLKRMLRPLPQKLMTSFVEAEEALKQEMKQQLSRRRERLARGQQPLLEWDDDYDMKKK
ncbi:unnamed protein product, partial [Mesorhabditis spiculigera]